jgi:hypothetical protein
MPAAAQTAIFEHGFAVVERDAAPPSAMRDFYRGLAARELPIALTVDALAELVHVAVYAAMAEVEQREFEGGLHELLSHLGPRFDALARNPSIDLGRAVRIARGIVAVTRALLDDASPPSDLATEVNEEVRRVREGRGRERGATARESVLLRVPIEYRAPGGGAIDPERRKLQDAVTWLARAPLVLAGRDLPRGPSVSVATARDHTRAALLFAYALHPKVDAEAAATFDRLDALQTFLIGPADDWSPSELGALAAHERVDVTDLAAIADVARIDRVRRAATRRYRARLHDGGGSRTWVEALEMPKDLRERRFAPPTSRLLGARLTLDGIVQQLLVHPAVGAYRGNQSVFTVTRGKRTLPRALDLAAVMGSADAHDALHEEGDDAYEGYDAALKRLIERRPPENEVLRHASVYLSSLDLVSAILTTSAGDAVVPGAKDPLYRRRLLECALVSYTSLRADFSRGGRAQSRAIPTPTAIEPRPALVVVEPHLEALARMVALVRQVQNGLTAYRALGDRFGVKIVAIAERLLTTAFEVALLTANGAAPSQEQRDQLATIPGWLEELEGMSRAEEVRFVEAHVDLATRRALVLGRGKVREIAVALRDPTTRRLVLAFGAASTHHEIAVERDEVLDDAEWQARVDRNALPRAAWTAAYRFAGPCPSAGVRDCTPASEVKP